MDELNVHLGGDGIPFLTQKNTVPDYKNNMASRLRPQSIRKARVDIFDLSNPVDYERYGKIWDAVGMGVATVVEEDRHWVDSKENWKIFVRWYVGSIMDPGELRSARLEKANDLINPIVPQQSCINPSGQLAQLTQNNDVI